MPPGMVFDRMAWRRSRYYPHFFYGRTQWAGLAFYPDGRLIVEMMVMVNMRSEPW